MKATKLEKVAICKAPKTETTYGYIYKVGKSFGYYMCGSSIPEQTGSLKKVEEYVKSYWTLDIKRMAKFRNL